ncbi:MAG: hypothetical protein BWK76_28305 [Desulfobulbaceae bacterium A2]|nr:MAG: hypothetical protein BWK76_28305 [Desulfobulbaceae bacterium A2]
MNWFTRLFSGNATETAPKPKDNRHTGATPAEQYALSLTSAELQGIISGQRIPDPPQGYRQKVDVPKDVAQWAAPVVKTLESADSAANAGKLDLAFATYTSIITAGVRCGVAAMSASFCCFHQDKWDLALKYIKMAEEFDPVSTRIKENVKYIVDECAKRDVYETAKVTSQKNVESGQVRLVEKKQLPGQLIGKDTYEVYQADTVADATAFLNGRNIVEQQYYVIVETPEGIVGKDKGGVYKPSKNWRGDDWNRY